MTRKILLSVLVIGALLVAVAGITMAVFSDNEASDDQFFTAGTVNIEVGEDVDPEDGLFDTTLDMPNMEAGDCEEQIIRVSNVGTLDVNLWNWIYTSGDIFSCDPNASCNMTVTKEFWAEQDPPDGTQEFIPSGGWEEYKLKACLPLCAGNDCQGDSGEMRMFFHAVQDSNLEGYECVKLEDKDAPDWIPDPTTPAHGNVCYKVDGSDLEVVLNGYSLTPLANFQLALDGGDTNDGEDAGCTTQDANLLSMSPDIYVAGYWNWGTYLEQPNCLPNNGGEGVWNYAGVYSGDAVTAGGTGSISYAGTLSGLPGGSYVVKANVKEVTGALPGTVWTGVLSGLDYLRFTIP